MIQHLHRKKFTICRKMLNIKVWMAQFSGQGLTVDTALPFFLISHIHVLKMFQTPVPKTLNHLSAPLSESCAGSALNCGHVDGKPC